MSAIPSNAGRVPNILATQIAMENLTRNNVDLLRLGAQMSSGRRVDRASDDPVASSLISVLDGRINRADQRLRNFSHASSSLASLDQLLGDAHEMALEARTLGQSQIGVNSDADTRRAQAVVVQSLITELQSVANRAYDGLHLLGGSRTGRAPIESFFDGYRYAGVGDGLRTDLGPGLDIPITIGADEALGALSARVEGDVDLNPRLTRSTKLEDVRGANDLGVDLGEIEITIDNGVPVTVTVDLSNAANVGNVLDAIESAIRQTDPAALAGVFPGGLDIVPAGDRFEVNAAAGYTITFADPGDTTTASDLGLTGFSYDTANPDNPAVDLDPALTRHVAFGDLVPGGAAFPNGTIVFSNSGRTGSVTVTAGMTIAEFQRGVEALNLGIRVEIDEDGRSLNVFNEVSGWEMSVEEDGGGTLTATAMGIRTFKDSTPLSVFNGGRGVQIADGVLDPTTGLADPDRNVDFRVTLTDGRTFDVDLRPQDIADVGTVLARINAQAAAAVPPIAVPADFEAVLADGGNGIVFTDNAGGGGTVGVASLNGFAAEDLGLLDGSFTPGAPAILAGSDRATVRVDSLLTTLMDLRTALEANDERGIRFATERLESDTDRLATTRAVVGGRAGRLGDAQRREEDSTLLDETIRSGLQDLDYVEATSRFSLLQLVQQAGYTATAQAQSLTLLNFLR